MPVFSPFTADAIQRAMRGTKTMFGMGGPDPYRDAIRSADPELREDWADTQARLRSKYSWNSLAPLGGLALGTAIGGGINLYNNLDNYKSMLGKTHQPYSDSQANVVGAKKAQNAAENAYTTERINNENSPKLPGLKKDFESKKSLTTGAENLRDITRADHAKSKKTIGRSMAPWLIGGAVLGTGVGMWYKNKKKKEKEKAFKNYAGLSPQLQKELEGRRKRRENAFGNTGL